MFLLGRPSFTALALLLLALPSSARVVWVPTEFDPNEGHSLLSRDDSSTSAPVSCGNSYPSDFTCPIGSKCLPLNTSSSISAVLCCPSGRDCSVITPVNCDQTAQNATINPESELHADPTTQLETCGSDCCPMGYSCNGGNCYMQSTAASSSVAVSSSTASATPSASSAASSVASSIQETSAPTAAGSSVLGEPSSGSSVKFSGPSFAAGFVPGIFLGALITACVLIIVSRKKRRTPEIRINEKHNSRDTLTDLGPLSRRPTKHGRSISEPVVDATAGYRTDFLRTTPPRGTERTNMTDGYDVGVSAPAEGLTTPRQAPKAVKGLFSRSPFLNQTPSTPPSRHPPLPAHLKRGTLSFTVSPIRALKKQKSMHSLRRQMTDASRSSSRRMRPNISRSGSTETIQVLMPSNEPYTPDQRPHVIAEDAPETLGSSNYKAADSTSTWCTTDNASSRLDGSTQYASSSRYPTQTFTPTPPGRSGATAEGWLGTPYTPSKYAGNGKARAIDVPGGDDGGLKVCGQPDKRDTTFSAMMERAGLRKSDLVMGTGKK